MSVYKDPRSPNYTYEFQISGHRSKGPCLGCKNERDAKAFERKRRAEVEEEIKHGLSIDSDMPRTLVEAFDKYMEQVGNHVDDGGDNSKAIRHNLDLILEYFESRKPAIRNLNEVTDSNIAELVQWRRGHYRWNDPESGHITPATVNRTTLSPLRSVFTRAQKVWKVPLPKCPNWGQHWLTEPEERVRVLTHKEYDYFCAQIGEGYIDLLEFALSSGLRQESSLLKWADVDFGARKFKYVSKGKKARTKSMTAKAEAILRKCQGNHPVWVFTYVARRTLRKQNIYRGARLPITISGLGSQWSRARDHGGIVNLRWHDLRHTFATNLLEATDNLALVKVALDHSNIKTTMKYAHVRDSKLLEGMEKADRNLAKTMSA